MRYKRGFVDGEYQDGEVRGLVSLAGKRGMGKTTEVVRLLRACSGPVIFYDTKSKHAHYVPEFTVVHEPGQLKEAIRRNPRKFRVLYQPLRGDSLQHFENVCEIVAGVGKGIGGVVLAVDEVDYHTCSSIERVKITTPKFYDLIEYGRHFWTAMLFTFRKPANVPRGMTSECLEHRIFRTTESIYLSYWESVVGDKRTAQMLKALPKYHYMLCRDGEDAEIQSAGRLIKKLS